MQRFRWLWGRHPVEETLKSRGRQVKEFWVLTGAGGSHIKELVQAARRAGAKVKWVTAGELDRVSNNAPHQGLAALVSEKSSEDFSTALDKFTGDKDAVLVALDQIQDPHNFGAIARSAACLGVKALLVTERKSSPVTQTVVQASAGAIEHIPVVDVGNLSTALLKLKEAGFWVYGADMAGAPSWKTTFNRPMVLVVGSEGTGIRSLVKERCDELVSIPQSGGVASLNASCAASVLLYEIARQKTQ